MTVAAIKAELLPIVSTGPGPKRCNALRCQCLAAWFGRRCCRLLIVIPAIYAVVKGIGVGVHQNTCSLRNTRQGEVPVPRRTES